MMRLRKPGLVRAIACASILFGAGIATSIFTGCFHYRWGHPRNSIVGGYDHPIASLVTTIAGLPGLPTAPMVNHFAWGIAAFWPFLAVCLVARRDYWKSHSSRLRLCIFIALFVTGGLGASAFQQMLHQIQADGYPPGGFGFSLPLSQFQFDRLPGTNLRDYALPLFDCRAIATTIWVLFPAWITLRFRLTDTESFVHRRCVFSISTIAIWTAALAGLVAVTQVLTWWGAPGSYLTNYSVSSSVADFFVIRVPASIVAAVTALTIGYAWTLRLPKNLLALCVVIWLGGIGNHFIYSTLAPGLNTPIPRYDVFVAPSLLYWSYIVGQGLGVWLAFGLAASYGLQLRFPNRRLAPAADQV